MYLQAAFRRIIQIVLFIGYHFLQSIISEIVLRLQSKSKVELESKMVKTIMSTRVSM